MLAVLDRSRSLGKVQFLCRDNGFDALVLAQTVVQLLDFRMNKMQLVLDGYNLTHRVRHKNAS